MSGIDLNGDPKNLVQRGLSEKGLGETILQHGLHTLFYRRGPDQTAPPSLYDHLLRLIVDFEEFKDVRPRSPAALEPAFVSCPLQPSDSAWRKRR